MKKVLSSLVLLLTLSCGLGYTSTSHAQEQKLVIAHRGASGYLPEHTLEAKAMAYAMGADYIEQDVVMTKDDRLVILHDHYLDRVTNVAEVYPDRKRADGRYYVIDFTLDEIKRLRVTEGFDLKNGAQVPNYEGRFPMWKSSFQISTLEEEIELIQGLNKSTGRNVGIYPEIKAPWFHRHEGKDISLAVLKVLKSYGYDSRDDKVYVQCFDPNETKRIHDELLPKLQMDVKLVQLMAVNDWNETMVYQNGKAVPYDYDWMFQPGAMKKIAEYADGVGPWWPMVIREDSTRDRLNITNLVKEAHAAGLEVHPYTFRLDDGQIPAFAASFEELLDLFYFTADVDGVFTDFPDRAVQFLRRAEFRANGYSQN
ncbi:MULTISPECIES: glycerophosphodiester phosphodiesterase [Bacillales]|jgi:glycerophosphoryl diester phosphodiesterase|uniref:glycerophosphodiester phosphodiesterase n=1 Tax=Brevibacillus aydinogluensis TaxID=927786 RepID=A0AA48M3V8_9BACL|nr:MULTISPECIES: glycerophosphodiester phosphodiesterase [Bacillales]REK66333.1 MAG: glycerophosphodiester phosphodiesterase [Brevibacillus sp.]MBR8660978.1 glycerophosphodiester phosphodiesterase [Brevibacillus sp. NL20B1]MDT3416258.1 glycerophosphoryl diester phosphodiesterase [Brevibacillus aydinogluensis]NNV01160.1 glycerophosphodiester phosphodiesterase [Brevibacillus sp. MCWH]UFJ62140.1 glycerophosphodiester phosphodiesterase [Anoxybacillus sediminis]